ncbi:hypothetical protein [Nocardia xishanensis]|uniref:hypothetical protein n=1 Tax=Nocardia xishanensis TaxID=238964 RepID=UPI0033F9AB28
MIDHASVVSNDATSAIEVVVARDPDGPTEIQVFIDGFPRTITEYHVDPGAGWTWTDWTRARDHNLANASPAARAALRQVYANPPGGEYISDRGGASWLDDTEVDGAESCRNQECD